MDDTINLYDSVLNAIITNILIFSKDNGKIIFQNFDKNKDSHKLMLHAAWIALMNPDRNREVYVEMNPIKFLICKNLYKNFIQLKRYTEHKPDDKLIDIEAMQQFIITEFQTDANIFELIYDKYFNK